MGQRASRFGRVRLAAPKHRLQPDQRDQGAGGEDQYEQQRRVRARLQEQQRERRRQQQQRSRPCPVCLSEMDEPAANTTLTCKGRHQIHSECWQGWRASNSERGRTPTCPICRQQIAPQGRAPIDAASAFSMWPPAPDTHWPSGAPILAHVRADDDVAVGRAIHALRRLPYVVLRYLSRSSLPIVAEEIASSILLGDNIPAGPARDELRRWMRENPNARLAGHNLIHDRLVDAHAPADARLTPRARALARSVLAPLTSNVLYRVAEILRSALF